MLEQTVYMTAARLGWAPSEAGGQAPGQHTRASHVSHSKLEEDVTDPKDRLALSELFRESNREVYRLIQEDERATVLPHGAKSEAYDARFLDVVWDREA